MAYVVFFQPIDPYTNAQNAALAGEIFDLDELLDEKGGGKSYCDGQVSPTPPRHSDDGMMGLYFESREVAEEVSRSFREEVASRVRSGELKLSFDLPWLKSLLFSTAGVEVVAADIRTRYSPEVTDSQILNASQQCALELGRVPTAQELFEWIEAHRAFPTD